MDSSTVRGYLDLLVALGWLSAAAAAIALSLDGIARLVLLIPTTIFLPGYALVSLAYPTAGAPPEEATITPSGTGLRKTFSRGNHAIGGVERIGLAAVWSVVLVPAITLAVHFSPFPITARPIQVGVFGVTLLLLLGAFVSRARQPADERFSPTIPALYGGSSSRDGGSPLGSATGSSGLGGQSSSTSGSQILLAVSLLVLASSVGYAFVAPPQDDGFTELYVQSSNVTDQTTSLYPSTLVRGQTQPFEFAVTNHEGSSVEYGYMVALQRIDRPTSGTQTNSSNTSGAGNASAEVVAQTEVDRGTFELDDGATRNVTARVTPQTTGDDLRVVVLVYRGDPPSDPSMEGAYRSLRLPINVTSGSGNGSAGGGTDTSALSPPRGTH